MAGDDGIPPAEPVPATSATIPPNPVDESAPLVPPPSGTITTEPAHPPQPPLPGDSAITKAEKVERHGLPEPASPPPGGEFERSPTKRVKLDKGQAESSGRDRQKGVAPIKPEYLIDPATLRHGRAVAQKDPDDDAAEASKHAAQDGEQKTGRRGKKDKERGQNKAREHFKQRDTLPLCSTVAFSNEFSPKECQFGPKCKYEHDIRKYLKEGKHGDLSTFTICPVWDVRGWCPAGWKCRLVGTHSDEVARPDGRQELVLIEDPERKARADKAKAELGDELGHINVVSPQAKIELGKKKRKTPKADAYLEYLNQFNEETRKKEPAPAGDAEAKDAKEDNRAQYKEPPFLPSEKRRIYYGPETPVLAPLTTQGNLPFRRLCVDLGAQVTWSEMAMGMPLVQGAKSEWALIKAHESEATPPRFLGKSDVVAGYDNSKDLKFGAQVAGNKPWIALKTVEVLTALAPHLRAIDLNCGCPIDLVYRQGAGSALLDAHGKLDKMLRGMNAVSENIPITVKIRMGVKDNEPTAEKLVQRLVLGTAEARKSGEGPCGVAAITLHGRSRQQRYTRSADWGYISEVAALINRLNGERAAVIDTASDVDARHLPNGGKVYFVGNGDCYSHVDYYRAINEHKVDSVMVARGALIKPWIFEEIEQDQYLDKRSSERLAYIEKFVKYGLETWGSDEMGVGTTRRFLMEWLSFTCRYTPIGLLEHLPPNIQDRAPAFKGRDELETLMASDNYKDWIKISEMFLGKAPETFKFTPKHKSNAYEMEAEG
ncbi:trna-dihydrouridine synthase [Diplodia corticola]|uniref:tRNA-dihydrouridine(47) synthase [NAD(P)(+)] n=1 Tax=Diplodia corticola TaxID=236234 RepID=A0A1J9S850_9PEZI|nr:trna-dihydrouridine synthase [Diplodia corticola]OJD35757.1 trna-dihydrouridine synthase [Diplodia corticola]